MRQRRHARDPRPASFATLADDLKAVWTAPTTDARLKKRIVRTVNGGVEMYGRGGVKTYQGH